MSVVKSEFFFAFLEPASQPKRYFEHLQQKFPDVPSFTYCSGATTWLIFSGPVTTESPLLTPVTNPRVVVECTKDGSTCHLEVHFKQVKSFSVDTHEGDLFTLVSSLRKKSGYVLCGGLPMSMDVSFASKNLRNWTPMFNRCDHIDCLMWYKPCGNVLPPRCPKCSRLMYHIQDMIKRKKVISPKTKEKRLKAGSKYPKKYLTPKSLVKRLRNEKLDNRINKKRLKKLEKLDVEVEEMSGDDILAVVAEIEKTSKVQLEELLKEADITGNNRLCSFSRLNVSFVGKGDILREKWKQDVTDRLDFIKDQKKNCEYMHVYQY